MKDRGAPERGPETVLLEAVRQLSRASDPAEVLRLLAQLLRGRLKVHAVQFWLRQGGPEGFQLAAEAAPSDLSEPERKRLTCPSGLLARLTAQPEPVVLTDATRAPGEEPTWARKAGIVSLLGAPLLVEDEPVGAVLVLSRKRRAFSTEQVGLVQALATTAAVAIRNAGLHQAQLRRTAEARELAEIARAVSSARSVKEALREVCRRAAVLCGAERGSIYFWDEAATRLLPAMSVYADGRPRAAQSAQFKALSGQSVPRPGLIQRLIDTGEPVVIEDAANSPLVGSEWVEWFGFRSIVGVRLMVEGRGTGALFLDHTQVRPFSPAQVELATAIAGQVAFAIQKASRFEETQARLRQTEAHLEIARTLNSTLELRPLLKQIARQAARACEMDRCSIYLWEKERLVPVMAQFADGHKDTTMWDAFKRIEQVRVEEYPFFAEIVRTRSPLFLEHPEDDPRIPPAFQVFNSQAMLIVPLIRQDTVVGTFFLDYNVRDQAVTPAQIALATNIASQVALAIDNARLYGETERRLRETRALLSVAQTLGGSLDVQEIARRTAREVTVLLGADTSIFFGMDEKGEAMRGVAGYHVPEAVRGVDYRRSNEDVPPYLLEAEQTGRPVATSDVSTDPRFDHPVIHNMVMKPRAMVYAPVFSQGRLMGGLLTYWWTETRQFTEDELELAAGVAAQMAPVLANARLYAQAQRALTELQTAQERLVRSEKFRAMAEMAGGVAHDFNNLLTAILGRTQYLLHRLERGVSPPDVRRDLGVIEQAALDGAQTVRRLLEYTRAEPGRAMAIAIDARELLAHTVEVSRHRWKDEAEARGIHIQVVVEAGQVPAVVGSAADLREVLLNLVLNAVDAMPSGGTLTLSSREEAGWVCLEVRDTGIGMSEDVRRRAFDPFFTTKGPRSSGLGLSASYGIVRSHGGEIDVTSTPGQGTTFTIRLPVASGPVAAVRPPEPDRSAERIRVLVIDDEEPVRAVLRDLLVDVGHEVWVAKSGAEGLSLLETQAVDLVLTDLGMPGMTGWEVAERVKARWPDRKVGVVTGWGARVKPEEIEAHGVDFLVAKPFRIEDLLSLSARLTGRTAPTSRSR